MATLHGDLRVTAANEWFLTGRGGARLAWLRESLSGRLCRECAAGQPVLAVVRRGISIHGISTHFRCGFGDRAGFAQARRLLAVPRSHSRSATQTRLERVRASVSPASRIPSVYLLPADGLDS